MHDPPLNSDPITCKWKILYAMGPFQNLIHVMLQLCQIKPALKINYFLIVPPRNPSQHFGTIHSKYLTPWGSPTTIFNPMGLPHLNATLLYIFYISSCLLSYRWFFLSFFLYPPKTTKPPFFYNISPKGIPFLRH